MNKNQPRYPEDLKRELAKYAETMTYGEAAEKTIQKFPEYKNRLTAARANNIVLRYWEKHGKSRNSNTKKATKPVTKRLTGIFTNMIAEDRETIYKDISNFKKDGIRPVAILENLMEMYPEVVFPNSSNLMQMYARMTGTGYRARTRSVSPMPTQLPDSESREYLVTIKGPDFNLTGKAVTKNTYKKIMTAVLDD